MSLAAQYVMSNICQMQYPSQPAFYLMEILGDKFSDLFSSPAHRLTSDFVSKVSYINSHRT